MVYLLYGDELFLIKENIKKIIKSTDDINIVKYDLESTNLKNILEDADSISMFDDKKVIIVENSFIFIRTTKKTIEQPTELLEQYLNNINPDTILIFITNSQKLDSVKKIVKLIKEKGKVIECNKPSNINLAVKNMFEDYIITDDLIQLFINRVGNNLDIISQEVEKLKVYKIEDKKIIKEDILNLTTKSIDTDIFSFIDNIIKKNKKEALDTYYELLKLGEEPIKIIIMLANKFRLMYQACILRSKGNKTYDIASILGVHEYPVKLALETASIYDLNVILDFIKKLAKLDEDIKIGNVDAKLALELFIINL